MKKSEALKALGLSEGATDDEVKQAHRKLVIAHHPDKFALGSKERSDAEEFTKQINEARDVLLNRSWSPEYDPRRDPRPYANPYAHPTANPYGGAPSQGGAGQDPFAGWPFDQGRTTYVWTSWGDAQGAGGAQSSGFDPFAPFRTAEPQKTPAQVLEEARTALKREGGMVAVKVAILIALTLLGTPATGLFFYVMVSIIYGLWKRLGSCLIGFFIPIALVLAPVVFIISPKQGAVTGGLAVAFLIAVLFDFVNVRDRIRVFRSARAAL